MAYKFHSLTKKHRYPTIKAKRKLLKIDINFDFKNIGLDAHLTVNAALQKQYISEEALKHHFSACFIRNPWDHNISQLHEPQKDPSHSSINFDAYISRKKLEQFAQN